jgi:glycosyltransferase involved in cell wall biosynthesis
MKDTYLVIPTHHIGGAEKRLIRIWLELYKEHPENLFLILSKELNIQLKKLAEFDELRCARKNINDDLISTQTSETLRSVRQFSETTRTPSILHYVLIPPIIRSSEHAYIYSFPSSSFKNLNWKGHLSTYIGFLRADAIDILSPTIYRRLKKALPFKNVQLSPGSFVDNEFYDHKEGEPRKNSISFCGLLSFEKQADRFLAGIPLIYQKLKADGFDDISFNVMGRPTGEFSVDDITENDHRFRDIDLNIGFESNPQQILSVSKVFLSLQRADNYPSRSLLEAIACGCLPVVTDTGSSRLIAPEFLAEYVPKDFTAHDLAIACSNILKLDEHEYREKSARLRAYTKEKFSLETSVAYFERLYNSL